MTDTERMVALLEDLLTEIRTFRAAVELRWAGETPSRSAAKRVATTKTGTALMYERSLSAPNPTRQLIAAYCEAFKARYGVNPPIDGAAQGAAKRILAAIPLERARDVVQAYLQCEDPWFLKKTHDLPTLAANLAGVVVSLANGTATAGERAYWRKVFGDMGGTDDQRLLPDAGGTAEENVGRTLLPRGTGPDPVEGIQ